MKKIPKSVLCLLWVLLQAPLAAFAEKQTSGRDFNHLSTGFPLSAAHSHAACETCHVGGVFKGTPKNCEGCHALGKRILATPKSGTHVVTDAPCESCHFNAATWLGARFNHGTAQAGACATCHNARLAAGKSSTHIQTTAACDQCHRTSAWLPASWNHSGAQYAGLDCATSCHNGAVARTFTNTAYHNSYTAIGITSCKSCHSNYTSFYVYRYGHNDAAFAAKADCLGCHDGSKVGVRGIPSNHSYALANLINAPGNCNGCHSTTSTWAGMNHGVIKSGTLCQDCHLTGKQNFSGMRQRGVGHEGWSGAGDCTNSGCHSASNFSTWDD